MPAELARARALVGLAVATLVVGGCGVSPDADSPQVAYEDAASDEPLEIPPDLVRPQDADSVDVPAQRDTSTRGSETATGSNSAGVDEAGGETGASGPGQLLPRFDGIRLVRGADTAWLEIEGQSPQQIWPRLDAFIRSLGLKVARKDPELGLIETGWFDRGDRPAKQGISGYISGLFSGNGETQRDRYQIQLERGNGGTRVFVEHRRVAETRQSNDPTGRDLIRWTYRGGDTAVENEVRKRLLVFLGVAEQRAQGIIQQAEAERLRGGRAVFQADGEDGPVIRVTGADYRIVFAQVGRVLERIDADTRVTDREGGAYRVDWRPPQASEDRSFQVAIERKQDGPGIHVVADADGASAEQRRALLRRLNEAMGGTVDSAGSDDSAPAVSAEDGGGGTSDSDNAETSSDDNRDYEDADGDGLPDDLPQ
jgi:outer membrane protein assembly factor BamC